MDAFKNVTFEEIQIGNEATIEHVLSQVDIEALALLTGDVDPFHVSDVGGAQIKTDVKSTEAIGSQALINSVLGTRLPGPGMVIVREDLRFSGFLLVGDALTASVGVTAKRSEGREVDFECRCTNQRGELLASGQITVIAPSRRLEFIEEAPPRLELRRNDGFVPLFEACRRLSPVACAVVHPCDRDSLLGAIQAAQHGLITPVLVGPRERIESIARTESVELAGFTIVSTRHSVESAEKAVELARSGEVEALMKGSLHTDELMTAVVSSSGGLRTSRRVSHVFVLDVPTYERLLLVTDAAVNITPGLEEKADITQNSIDLAHVLGIQEPRVAILAAVETVTPKMPSTVEAAALCKMSERGQIKGGILDGPLAFDNAISEHAARVKQIVSPVAGRADILLVPDLEAGNILAKQLIYLAGAEAAGIILGTRVPIVLTSRSDSVRARLASTAVLVLVAHARREGRFPIK